MEEAASGAVVDIQINKAGPAGRPIAIVSVPDTIPLDAITKVVQREITRNNDLRTKLGLKGCPACAASGIDLAIRKRFDYVLRVNLADVG